ncbi:retrotransposable element Tf2 [Tanacetum coccineum]
MWCLTRKEEISDESSNKILKKGTKLSVPKKIPALREVLMTEAHSVLLFSIPSRFRRRCIMISSNTSGEWKNSRAPICWDPGLVSGVLEGPEMIEIREDLSYTEEPESILDRQVRVMRNKTIPFVKILWRNHPEREATWETEESIRTSYPHCSFQVICTREDGVIPFCFLPFTASLSRDYDVRLLSGAVPELAVSQNSQLQNSHLQNSQFLRTSSSRTRSFSEFASPNLAVFQNLQFFQNSHFFRISSFLEHPVFRIGSSQNS